jgi:glycosyltransferase involved in cell wall biosynthesis
VPQQKFTDKLEARKALELPESGRIIVSVGNQDTRKGIDLLLLAFEQANLNADDYLVLMGKFDTTVKKVAARISQNKAIGRRLVVRDRFVSDDELQQAVVASDLVAVPYRDTECPSGIISRAVAWGRPLIGTNRGWIKWFLDRYEAGFPTRPESTAQFAADLQQALLSCDQVASNHAAEEFRRFNTKANYMDAWKSTGPTAIERGFN